MPAHFELAAVSPGCYCRDTSEQVVVVVAAGNSLRRAGRERDVVQCKLCRVRKHPTATDVTRLDESSRPSHDPGFRVRFYVECGFDAVFVKG